MKGSGVPYHLRPNKYVERQLFVELLEHAINLRDVDDWAYLSLGGKTLEDHRAIHGRLRLKKMLSFEGDLQEHQRQEFNKPLGLFECRHGHSSTLVYEIEALKKELRAKQSCVWLDYAAANRRREQLAELSELASRSEPGDIIKITMNANPATLVEKRAGVSESAIWPERLERLRETIEEYLEGGETPEEVGKQSGLAKTLIKAIRNSLIKGVRHTPLSVKPLALFRYKDQYHQMVTATIALLGENEPEAGLLSLEDLENWSWLAKSWEDIKFIDVPILSLREKLTLDQFIHTDEPDQLVNKLPFSLHENQHEAANILKQYERHYRRYPNFVLADL